MNFILAPKIKSQMLKDSEKKKKQGGTSLGADDGENLDSSKFASETQESEVSVLVN